MSKGNEKIEDIENLESRMLYIEKTLEDVNAVDNEGRTALHRAAEIGDEGMILILAKNNANWVCVTNEEEETPLHLSVKNGHLRTTELLLRHYKVYPKSNLLDAQTKNTGFTAMHIAVQMGRVDLVKCLMKYEAKHFIRDKNENTAVNMAKDAKIIQLFNRMFEFFKMLRADDKRIVQKLRELEHDDLMAIGNAGDEIQWRTIHNNLMCRYIHGSFHGDAWEIIYAGEMKDRENFEKMYADRRHRYRS